MENSGPWLIYLNLALNSYYKTPASGQDGVKKNNWILPTETAKNIQNIWNDGLQNTGQKMVKKIILETQETT